MNLFNPFRSSRLTPKPAPAPAPPPPPAELSAEARARLDYLFRLGPRSGAINPLLYVLTRYRAGQEAEGK